MTMKKRKTSRVAKSTRPKAAKAKPAVEESGLVGDEITESVAFRRATIDAEGCARDPARLRQLVEDAVGKISVIPRGPFADTWPYLMAMIRLLRDFHRAEYRDISEA